ncbi:MAG TPA: outer membrane beta-barrel protein [Gemmatimonadales bacterium]|nr:outer membrane beta-barrel protein [Gemmatimonadales bacterium]
MTRTILAGLAAALLAGSGTAHAQRPQATRLPTRWMLNAHTVAAFGTTVRDPLAITTLRTGLGAGGGLTVGYLLTPHLTAFASADVTKQSSRTIGLVGDFRLTHIEAGARVSLPVRSAPNLVPYALAAVGRRSLGTTVVDLEGNTAKIGLSGMTVGLGAGAQYFLSPALALDAGATLGLGTFGGSVTINGVKTPVPDLQRSTVTRLMFGVSWYR